MKNKMKNKMGNKMDSVIKHRKWFWAWQDEQEEAWLHEMSLQGLHLVQAHAFGLYYFAQGEPRSYVYRLDYRDTHSDQESYLQLFADAGWEHVGQMVSWEYFRKETAPNTMPEIYTDADSKIQKYRRLQWFTALLLPFVLIAFPSGFEYTSLFQLIVNLFLLVSSCALAALLGINWLKLEQRIQQIRRL
jgi:hypothetical protein